MITSSRFNRRKLLLRSMPASRAAPWLQAHGETRADLLTPLSLMPPRGDLVLDETATPLVLLTGGVGLAPAVAMLLEGVPA